MGKRRGRPSKKEKEQKKTISSDMLGGFLVVFGLILAVCIGFKNLGTFARICKVILKGALGNSAYSFPILLIIVGTYLIMSEKKVKVWNALKKGMLVIALFAATLTVFTESNVTMYSNPVKTIFDSINTGIAGANYGGAVGTIVGGLVAGIIGMIPSRILFPILTFIITLFVCNISFKQFFGGISYGLNYIADHLNNLVNTLFRDDEVKQYDSKSMSRKERAKLEKQNELLKEEGTKNADENLKTGSSDQLIFDFNKIGGEPTKEDIESQQKRDKYFKLQKEEKEDKSLKEVLTLDHTAHTEEDNYVFPSVDLLAKPTYTDVLDKKAIRNVAIKLQKTLASFGVEAKVTDVTKGPTVTRYELTPNTGVKVSKIVNLADDIALNLAAKTIRIEAPIPGKAAVGIEVPNEVKESVPIREVIDSDVFKNSKSKLTFALGKNAANEICVGDIAKMPHMLIAGSTGSGKSVCINSIIISILYKAKPSEVKMILVDPKMVELSGYNGIPHLLIPVVTDPKKAAGALNWAVQEMVNRYNLFASKNVKDIKGYNEAMEKEEDGVKLPQIVIIIDELADLMMVAPNDVEDAICRLAQMARAAGMHLVIATQRPSVDVITGIIKANIPSRIAFTVSSQVDSRTILDMAGAEKLLGKGDMLYYPVGEAKPLRMQGTFISESEIESIVDEIKANTDMKYNEDIIESIEKANGKPATTENTDSEDDADELLNSAIDLVVDVGQASTSMLQRKFKIGHSRAGRIVDQMEARGLVSGYEGSKPRQVLISKEEWEELKMGAKGNNVPNVENNSSDSSNTDENTSSNDNEQKKSNIDIEL